MTELAAELVRLRSEGFADDADSLERFAEGDDAVMESKHNTYERGE